MMRAIQLVVVCVAVASGGQVQAGIMWDWSFNSEAGHFATDGSVPVAGTYTMTDFFVSSSAVGGAIGSLSGGEYATNAFSTDEPFSFVWDGSQVTQWLQSGANTFDWWSFRETIDMNRNYLFAWDTGNVNDPTRAAYFDSSSNSALSVGDVSVSPANIAVPEPSSLAIFGIGAGVLGLVPIRRREQKQSATT